MVGLMSIYSNMRSNSASDPDISTPRSSRFAIGNRSLACMVVNATMSPSDTLSLPSMISIPPMSHMNAGAIVKNAWTSTKNPRPVMYWRIDRSVSRVFVS